MSEINQIMACDSDDVGKLLSSILKDAEDTAVLSSPYFLRNEDTFTDLLVKEIEYKDVDTSPGDNILHIVVSQDKITTISFNGKVVNDLEIRDLFSQPHTFSATKIDYVSGGETTEVQIIIPGSILLVEKSNGDVLRAVSVDDSTNLVSWISQKLLDYIESDSGKGKINIINSTWEVI